MELGQVRAGSDEFLTLFSVKWGQGTCSEGEAGAGCRGLGREEEQHSEWGEQMPRGLC